MQKKKLQTRFKVFVVEHLIIQLIRKTLKKPLRKLKKNWILSEDSDLKFKRLSPTRALHSKKLGRRKDANDYSINLDYDSGCIDKSRLLNEQSPFERRYKDHITYTLSSKYYNYNNPLAYSQYSSS